MSFFEERFPECIRFGVTGGPRFSTGRTVAQNGFTAKQRNWRYPLQRFEAAHGIKSESDFEKVRAFFYNVYGGFDGFRFRDWSDYQVKAGQGVVIVRDDGLRQLARAYTYGARVFTRPIAKPVPGSVQLSGPGVVDYTTGLVTGGTPATWTGQFDVPVEFADDLMDVEVVNKKGASGEFFLSWASLQLQEIRIP